MLIIVPTYDERENLSPLITQIHAVLPEAHVLVVDDNSPDGTGALAVRLAQNDPRVHVMVRRAKLGLGTAYREGFAWALARDFELIFEMDADGSHDAGHLPEMVRVADEGADVVVGSRRVSGGGTENWGLLRRVISAGGNLYASTILGTQVRDLTSGFKCFHRRVLASIDLGAVRSEGYSFQIEMTHRALSLGFRVEEVPITFVDRRVGQSKMSRRIFIEAVYMVWLLRFGVAR